MPLTGGRGFAELFMQTNEVWPLDVPLSLLELTEEIQAVRKMRLESLITFSRTEIERSL